MLLWPLNVCKGISFIQLLCMTDLHIYREQFMSSFQNYLSKVWQKKQEKQNFIHLLQDLAGQKHPSVPQIRSGKK